MRWAGHVARMDWIGRAQDRDRRRTLVSAVMNFRVPWNAGNFLTSCKPVSCSRRTLQHWVSMLFLISLPTWPNNDTLCITVVGTATRYGLDGPRIKSRGSKFSAPVQTGPGAHHAPHTMCTGSISGVKRRARGVTTHHQLAPRLKKEYGYTSPPLDLRRLF